MPGARFLILTVKLDCASTPEQREDGVLHHPFACGIVALTLVAHLADMPDSSDDQKQERRLPLYCSVRPCAMIEVEAYMACTGKGSLPPRATSRSIRTGWSRACVPPHYHPRASQEALGDVAVSPDICNKNINCAARLEETRKPATCTVTLDCSGCKILTAGTTKTLYSAHRPRWRLLNLKRVGATIPPSDRSAITTVMHSKLRF